MDARTKTSGFTVVEALISIVLFATVLGGLAMATRRGNELFGQSTASLEVEARLDRTIERLEDLLMGASVAGLNPDLTSPVGGPVVWSTNLDWPRVDFVAGAVVDGPITRLELRLAGGEIENGVDDNDNELIDDHQLVWIDDFGGPNERQTVLVNGVASFLEGETANALDDNGNGLIDERGVAFDIDGDTLNVRLTLEHPGPAGSVVQRTNVASISLRN